MTWSHRWDDVEVITIVSSDAPDMEGVEIEVIVPDLGERARALALAEVIATTLNVLDGQEWEAIEDAAVAELANGSDTD